LTTDFGDHSDRVTPVPISNTEVKPVSADGTWGVIPWESRTSPDFDQERTDRMLPAVRFLRFRPDCRRHFADATLPAWTACRASGRSMATHVERPPRTITAPLGGPSAIERRVEVVRFQE
jgi:hypothetical protein